MPEAVDFSPEWAAAPGLTISHALEQRGMTYDELADALQRPRHFVFDLVAGREEITSELAEALARSVGSTKRFWLARERNYRATLERLAGSTPDLNAWVSALPLQDMRRLGWIRQRSGSQLIAECLQFFGVSSLAHWKQGFEAAVLTATFRSSAAYETRPASLSAWLRQGEVQAASLKCEKWNSGKFRECLRSIRNLTRQKSPNQFVPALQRMCSRVGVAVVVVQAPDGCRASGAARFISSDRALIQLSRRYGTDDQFWFTFFHEAGHLLLHPKADLFVDEEYSNDTREEVEANAFAQEVLLDKAQREELKRLPLTYRAVIRFARRVDLAPGVIVGQLQHSKAAGYERLNKAKRRLDWSTFND